MYTHNHYVYNACVGYRPMYTCVRRDSCCSCSFPSKLSQLNVFTKQCTKLSQLNVFTKQCTKLLQLNVFTKQCTKLSQLKVFTKQCIIIYVSLIVKQALLFKYISLEFVPDTNQCRANMVQFPAEGNN